MIEKFGFKKMYLSYITVLSKKGLIELGRQNCDESITLRCVDKCSHKAHLFQIVHLQLYSTIGDHLQLYSTIGDHLLMKEIEARKS